MGNFAIVLAASKGGRMKSGKEGFPKVCFPVLGKPMVSHVLSSISPLGFDRVITVVGYGAKMVEEVVATQSEMVYQENRRGTGYAVLSTSELIGKEEGLTLICCGDTPLLTSKTLAALISSHQTNHNDMTILTGIIANPWGYGRIVKENGQIEAVIEQKDASPDIEAIHEVNSGVYAIDNRLLFEILRNLAPKDANREFNLTEVVAALVKEGKRVGTFLCSDEQEILGVNDRVELSQAERIMRERINRRWMLSGVTIEDPNTTTIGPDVVLGQDCVIRPSTMILGNSILGKNNVVGPYSYLENVKVGEGNVIEMSHIIDSEVKNASHLGPYLNVRGNSVVGNENVLGNFNELKNVKTGDGVFCCHLSYLGDASVGDRVNVGAGTIIANYDGVNKFMTVVENDVFLGSGTILISPMTVGESALVAAGSVVSKDVPPHAMAIARGRQENKEGYADTYRENAKRKSPK